MTNFTFKRAGARGYSRLARAFTLAVMLLTMSTGAWAQEPTKYTVKMAEGNVELNVEYEPEFTATFKANTANTIEAGKATVTVDGTAATLTDGKLSPLYEGQTVTMTAATGYKFTDVKGIVANNWVNYGYTGSNTFFGTSNSSSRFTWTLMYTPSMLTGNYLKTVKAASRNTNPVTLKVYSGGDTPESGELIATQVYESPLANYYYDIELEQPVKFDQTKNLWIELSQVSEYAAYCGRQPTDSNGKIWYRVDDGTWSSNGRYTPVISIQVLSTIPATLSDDGKTASFDMPASDITMDYTLKRDLASNMTLNVLIDNKIVTADTRLRIAKNKQTGAYLPVSPLSFTLTDAIEQTELTLEQALAAKLQPVFYLKGENDTWTVAATDQQTGLPTGIAPGQTYAITLKADDNTPLYGGETAKSIAVTLFEGYPVTVAGGEYITYYSATENLKIENDDAQLYTITAVDGTKATAAEIPSANKEIPFLVYNKLQQEQEIVLIPTESQTDQAVYSGFKGTAEGQQISPTATTDSYVMTGKQFVWLKDAGLIAAQRCWLEVPKASAQSAPVITILTDGISTGVKGIEKGESTIDNGDWYDLNGRKLQGKPQQKGVYILNGKKVILR